MIEVVDYDPSWPRQFQALAARARTALGSRVLRIDHVGSTAVAGLAAKPIIDLDVLVQSTAVDAAIRTLADLGYAHEGDLGIVGREAFRSPIGEARHHLYLMTEGHPEWRRHLRFRDALRADPPLREAYARLKHTLAAQYGDDRTAYSHGKSDFIRAALESMSSGI